jgi:hypothetical protein
MTPMQPPVEAKPTNRWAARVELDKQYQAATAGISDADTKLLRGDGDYRLSLYAKVMLERANVTPDSYLEAYKTVFDRDCVLTREGMSQFYALINRGRTADAAMKYIKDYNPFADNYLVQESGSGRPPDSSDWSPLAKRLSALAGAPWNGERIPDRDFDEKYPL